jgi:hypothetical protein
LVLGVVGTKIKDLEFNGETSKSFSAFWFRTPPNRKLVSSTPAPAGRANHGVSKVLGRS